MRLDHLLSREKAEAEMQKLNRRSIGRRKSKDRDRTVWRSQKLASGNAHRAGFTETKPGFVMEALFKDCEKVLYRFQGSLSGSPKGKTEGRKRDLNCILTTAQRVILKKASWQRRNPLKTEYWVVRETSVPLQFDLSELKEEERNRLVSGSSDEKIKLQRAQGGCQGTIRR